MWKKSFDSIMVQLSNQQIKQATENIQSKNSNKDREKFYINGERFF